jgi:hypothetical protein
MFRADRGQAPKLDVDSKCTNAFDGFRPFVRFLPGCEPAKSRFCGRVVLRLQGHLRTGRLVLLESVDYPCVVYSVTHDEKLI